MSKLNAQCPTGFESQPSTVAPSRTLYLVASHVNPPQVKRLVDTLLSGNCRSRVVLHHDQHVSPLDVSEFSNRRVDVLPPSPMGWGTFRSCEMLLNALKWIRDRRDFDWVVYLSGQDYPLKPMFDIERELTTLGSRFDAMIDAKPREYCSWHFGTERYAFRYFDAPHLPGLSHLRRLVQRASTRLRDRANASNSIPAKLPRLYVARDKYGSHKIGIRSGLFGPGGLKLYAGSSWWSMSHRAVGTVLDFIDRTPALVDHYRRVLFAPNESFFVTALMNCPELRVQSNDNKRFIRWSRPETGHPDLLGVGSVPAMLDSGCHFARKIDARIDADVLDHLDAAVLPQTCETSP